MQASNYKENKLRWYPQQPQRFIFTNLSETCCETKRWKPFEPVGTWPGPAPKIPPKPSPGPSLQPSPGPVEPDLALHQGFPRASPGPSPEPCWTAGSAPKPPGTFSGTFSGSLLNLIWRLPDLLRNLLRNLVEPVDPNLTWLCTRFPEPCWTWPVSAPNPKPSREPSEPSPEPRWTGPGACTSAHRSYSGLKTPSTYAVGEKLWTFALIHVG